MDYNILIGGEAGQGMDTLASVVSLILKRKGFSVFAVKDYMSRIRGGHNFIVIRFGDRIFNSCKNGLDGIIALNSETISIHSHKLKKNSFIICDNSIETDESRALKLPLKETAKKSGNIKAAGSVAAGALMKLFGLNMSEAEGVFKREFNSQSVAGTNMKALAEGMEMTEKLYSIEPPGTFKNHMLLNGNQAVALGALAAGCRFYLAYPMTPSTSIMNYLDSTSETTGIAVIQAEDEIAAVNMAVGASFAGARAMTGTSGGGFSLMTEGLGLAGMTETPVVIANIQRPGPATGLPTRTAQGDLKFVINASQDEFPRMVIAIRSPEDAFYQTTRAFDLAYKYSIPVILLGDQYLADTYATVPFFDFGSIKNNMYLLEEDPGGYKPYSITGDGVSPRLVPGTIPGMTVLADSDEHDETGHITESAEVRNRMMDKRMKKIDSIKKDLIEPDFTGADKFDTLFIAWGSTCGPVRDAVKMLNSNVNAENAALLFGDVWPLPVRQLEKMSSKAKRIINVEQNYSGQFASVIREQTGIICNAGILKYDGRPLSAQEIVKEAEGVLNG